MQEDLTNLPTSEEGEETGTAPRTVTNRDLVFRTLAGFLGGLVGTMILFIALIAMNQVFRGASEETITQSPIVLFSILLGVFVSTLAGNISAVSLVFLFQREKYKKLFGTVSQVFLLNIMVCFFMIPVYLFVLSANFESILFPVGLHILLTAFLSALVQEVISNARYFMLGFYGLTFGMLVCFVGSMAFVAGSTDLVGIGSMVGILPLLTPLTWASMMCFGVLGEMIYGYLYTTFGTDFLGAMMTEDEVEEEEAEENPDA